MKLSQDGPTKIDREIDAALKLLSEAQPPGAMISRIQQNLETAATRPPQARLGLLFWTPAAGVAIVAILLLASSQAHWTGKKQRSLAETARMTAPAPLSTGTAAVQPATLSVASLPRQLAARPAAVRLRRRRHPQYRHAANFLSYPLTAQEKLILKFVQTAKPEDLRDLNPGYQAKIDVQQEAEFAAYLKSGDDSSRKGTEDARQSN